MAFERIYAFPLVFLHTLPYPNRRVIRRGGKEAAVGRESERPDCGCMPGEGLKAIPVILRIIDVKLYRVIIRGGCKDLRWVAG